jgi:hypothetical protein
MGRTSKRLDLKPLKPPKKIRTLKHLKLPKRIRERIARATVLVTRQRGRGILVPGGKILTAAHCITWSGAGGMVLGEWFVETIQTAAGASIQTQVCAAEPVADIAWILLMPPR